MGNPEIEKSLNLKIPNLSRSPEIEASAKVARYGGEVRDPRSEIRDLRSDIRIERSLKRLPLIRLDLILIRVLHPFIQPLVLFPEHVEDIFTGGITM